jgi:hypothetical protein
MREFDQLFTKVIDTTRKGKTKLSLVSGIVKSIDGDTCVVDLFEDVRLNAIIDELDSHFTVYPKVDTEVIMGRIEGKDTMFVLGVSEIEKVIIKIGNQSLEFKENNITINIGNQILEMKSGKFKITNGNVSLKSILNDGFDQLGKSIIMTPSGPGKFSVADKLVFQDLKDKTNQLLS